jgi:hypothetical protein
MIRGMLNSWLRRWAEASLRQQLHQEQDKVIRLQEVRDNLIKQSEEQTKARTARAKERKKNAAKAASYDEKLIKALRARMPDDLFRSVVAHVNGHAEDKE